MKIWPGLRCGKIVCPPSKSHVHRLLIASFLSGDTSLLEIEKSDCDDILATKRCLKALAQDDREVVLDCGESGSTLRFIAPIAAALGKQAQFIKSGNLSQRPFLQYDKLEAREYVISGDVSSQFATGLLFALPLLKGDSRIVFSTPLQSRGYVQMTLDVLKCYGIMIEEQRDGFVVRGNQQYKSPKIFAPEGDWSAAAFWLAMNALGSSIELSPLNELSLQPDVVAKELFVSPPSMIDVSECPDLFPALAVRVAARKGTTTIIGIERLRVKESDRVSAMEDMLKRFGVEIEVTSSKFVVHGRGELFRSAKVDSYGDHRIVMAAVVGATFADGPIEIDDSSCVKKSYAKFFEDFSSLSFVDENHTSLAALSLGSNIEPRKAYLTKAVEELSRIPSTRVVIESSIIETKGVDVPIEYVQDKFLNSAILLRTSLGVLEFSKKMHDIEDRLGRVRVIKNGPRTVDIDLIEFDDLEINTDELVLPHPRAAIRDFVRVPLAEIGHHIKTRGGTCPTA